MDVIVIGTKGMTAVEEYFLEVLLRKSSTMRIVQYSQSVDARVDPYLQSDLVFLEKI
jgi:hypothetical protein